MTDGIFVALMDIPCEIKGSVNINRDGTYTIIINSRLSIEAQREAYLHELDHIRQNDFEKYGVQQIEYEAHKRQHIEIK